MLGVSFSLGQLVPKFLYKGVWIVEIVIVENVLVLVRERLVRHRHIVHLAFLVQPGPPAAVDELVKVKGVFLFVGLSRVLEIGVLLQVVLFGVERRQAPKLQDAPVTGHSRQLAGGHQFPAHTLVVLAVTFRISPCPAIGLHGDRGLAQPVFGYFLDGAGFPASQENHAVHVTQDSFRVFIVNGFALSKLLIKQRQRHLAGSDNSHQLFKLRHLARIGRFVPQHPHMMGQAAPVNIVRPLTQEIEHLRKGQRHKEIVGAVRVADAEKGCCAPVAHAVKLQLVIGHDFPELGDVKGSQTSAAGNQDAFGRLARDELSRTF